MSFNKNSILVFMILFVNIDKTAIKIYLLNIKKLKKQSNINRFSPLYYLKERRRASKANDKIDYKVKP